MQPWTPKNLNPGMCCPRLRNPKAYISDLQLEPKLSNLHTLNPEAPSVNGYLQG